MADNIYASQTDPAGANVAVTAVGWISWPFVFVLQSIYNVLYYILYTLYSIVALILSPFTYSIRLLFTGLAIPYRTIVHFQEFFVYFAIAAVLGLLGGLIVHSIFRWLRIILRLNDVPAEHRGRTLQQYREDRRKAKSEAEPFQLTTGRFSSTPLVPGYVSVSDSSRRSRRPKSITAQTIMEEEDSEF